MAYAVRSDWDSLVTEKERPLALPDVAQVAEDIWFELKELCNLNSVKLSVEYGWDIFTKPGYSSVLARASRTMWLINDEWVSTALTGHDDLDGYIWIRVNPYVPNGWFVDDGNCNIGNHFDLKTVLTHEILHGVGISSSLRENAVGYFHNEICYPLQFDNNIQTGDGIKVVQGCNLTTVATGDLYMNNVQLFNPETFISGSSYSHTTKGLMYAYIPARTCLSLDSGAVEMLEALGAECGEVNGEINFHTSQSSGDQMYLSFLSLMLLIITILNHLKN